MGIFGNLFKPQPPTEEEKKKSTGVMNELRKRRGAETGKWLNLMMRDASNIPVPGPVSTVADVDSRDSINEAPYTPPVRAQYMTMSWKIDPALANQPLPKSEMVEWMNRLFMEFALQSAAFNASAHGTHLTVTVHAPDFEMEEPQPGAYTPEKKVNTFKGHLATLQWGMMVQGYEDKIDIYVVPADRVLDFMLHDIRKSSYTPFMTIDCNSVGSKKEWQIGGTPIALNAIPLLAKELLGDLVRVASGSLNEAELFGAHANELRLGETVAQGYSSGQEPAGSSGDSSLNAGIENASEYAAGMQSEVQSGDAPVSRSIETLDTWKAASALVGAMDIDLPWLIERKSDLDPAKDAADVERLSNLIATLRTLSGEIGMLLADYHPAKGSKYNAS